MDRLGRREFLGIGVSLVAAGTWCRGGDREAPEQRGGGPRIMQGKICLVTGATSGIGAAAALELARLGATVLVAGRDAAKCKAHADAIRRSGGRAEEIVADLASLDQVRRMAADVASRFPRLDVLVNNAGTYLFERMLTPDGLEKTFAVNYLSHFLLTRLLLDRLAASPSSRVVCVSSSAHRDGRIELDNLQGERHYERLDAYARSKLALLMFTYELARRRKGAPPATNAVHPGAVATDLGADNGLVRGWLRVRVRNAVGRSMITPEEGARSIVHLASSPALEGVTGRYFDRGQEVRSSPASYDEAVARRLWEVSEGLTLRKA